MPAVPTLLLRTFTSPVELRTPRILLRQWKDSDLDKWCVMNADAEVRKFFPKLLTSDEARDEMTRMRAGIAQRGWGLWAAEVPGTHVFIGLIGLNIPSYEAPWMPVVEVGWRLAPEAWHKGYATEGAAAALNFAFAHLELSQVIAISVAPNTSSHNVMTRLGMQRDTAADFDHPRVPPEWPLRRHILHRLPRESWQIHCQQPLTSAK